MVPLGPWKQENVPGLKAHWVAQPVPAGDSASLLVLQRLPVGTRACISKCSPWLKIERENRLFKLPAGVQQETTAEKSVAPGQPGGRRITGHFSTKACLLPGLPPPAHTETRRQTSSTCAPPHISHMLRCPWTHTEQIPRYPKEQKPTDTHMYKTHNGTSTYLHGFPDPSTHQHSRTRMQMHTLPESYTLVTTGRPVPRRHQGDGTLLLGRALENTTRCLSHSSGVS